MFWQCMCVPPDNVVPEMVNERNVNRFVRMAQETGYVNFLKVVNGLYIVL